MNLEMHSDEEEVENGETNVQDEFVEIDEDSMDIGFLFDLFKLFLKNE